MIQNQMKKNMKAAEGLIPAAALGEKT